jgi:hypothetical protein
MVQDLTDALNDLFNRKLGPVLDAQNEIINNLGNELSLLQGQLIRLEQRVADLEEFLQSQQGGVEEDQFVTALTEGDYIHHQLAQRYVSIVEQRLVQLVNMWLERHTPIDSDRFRVEARIVADLCLAFFGESGIDHNRLSAMFPDGLGAEVGRVCDLVSNLRVEAAEAGRHLWDFSCDNGPPDPGRHKVWHGCSVTAPVDFVVAPAYVALDRPFSRQLVFTEKVDADNKGASGRTPRRWSDPRQWFSA